MGKALRGGIVGAVALFAVSAHPAKAQRVISDYEASKLTLDALTATPVPVVHHASVRRVAMRGGRHAEFVGHHGLVHQVAFHPHAPAHAVSHHRHHT